METTVRHIVMTLLLLLSFSVSSQATNITNASHSVKCQLEEKSPQNKYGSLQQAFIDQNLMRVLSISDVEGVKLLSEIHSQNQRNRRVLENFAALRVVMHNLNLRSYFICCKDKYVLNKGMPIVLSGSDYYVFTLRHILI